MLNNLNTIENRFENIGKFIIKNRWPIIIALLLINIIAFTGLGKIATDSSIDGWFSEDDPITRSTDEFEKIFGNNDFVALLIEANDVFDPEILAMIRELGDELEEKVDFAKEVISLSDFEFIRAENDRIIIENLIPEDIPKDRETIDKLRRIAFSKDFFLNRLVSDDSKQTMIVIRLDSFPGDWEIKGEEEPNIRVGKSVFKVITQEKYKKYSIKATGMPFWILEEIVFNATEIPRILLTMLILSIIILIIFQKSVRGVIIPIITIFSSVIIVFGFMGHIGIKLNTILMTVPILLGIAVSIGYSMHVLNMIKRNFLITGKRAESVYYAIGRTGWPILFTALTTICSLLSFYFISLKPIQWLGFTSAFIIVSVYINVMILLPALMSFGKDKKPKAQYAEKKELWADNYFILFGNWVLNNSKSVIMVSIVFVGICIYGLTKLETNLNIKDTYGLKLDYISRMDYIAKTKIGSLLSYDILFDFKEIDAIKAPETLKKFETFSKKVKELKFTKRTTSLLDIIKDMNQVFHENDRNYYSIPDNKELTSQLLLLYEMSGGSEANEWTDSNYRILRLMVEVDELNAKELRKNIKLIEEYSAAIFPGIQVNIAGKMPQFNLMNKYVANGIIKSFLVALFVIMIFMMIVFKNIKAGLIGMIPNIIPAVAVGGIFGLAKIPLDNYTVGVIPMILGLAVDDTIHFITNVKYDFLNSNSYINAVSQTFKTVGKSILMTSVIIVTIFSVYLTSIGKMLFHIGLGVVIGISAALIADCFITPVLVKWTKPFGKLEQK